MKPQNYSLKFQNSLADCRITPGSQHLISRTNAKAPNGSRALRQPTKAELRKAVGRISKDTSARKGPVASSDVSATPLVQLLSKKAQKKAQAQAYAENRAVEKRREVKVAAARKGILKTTKLNTAEEDLSASIPDEQVEVRGTTT